MKCIKAIKSTKNVEIGGMIRVSNTEANQMVGTGYWTFIPKMEYKKFKRDVPVVTEQPTILPEQTVSEKQLKKKSEKKVKKS